MPSRLTNLTPYQLYVPRKVGDALKRREVGEGAMGTEAIVEVERWAECGQAVIRVGTRPLVCGRPDRAVPPTAPDPLTQAQDDPLSNP